MNKYQELVSLIKKHNLKVVKKDCYDSRSGWRGTNILLVDDKNFKHDLSGNGYCFNRLVR